jgi:hypothetical protein
MCNLAKKQRMECAMSNKQNPKKVRNEPTEEPKPTDELANEALDQVVGGGAPGAPTLPSVSKLDPGGCKLGPAHSMFPADKIQPPDTETK